MGILKECGMSNMTYDAPGRRLRCLVLHPGASWATADVYAGLVPALRAAGVELQEFPLDKRLPTAAEYLKFAWEREKTADPAAAEPTFLDTLFLCCERALTLSLLGQVDWVLVVSGMYVPLMIVELFKRAGIRVALLLTESPYDDEQQAKWAAAADVVWTNERISVPYLRRVQPETHYLPHVYDAARHGPEPPDENVPAHDVLFVGTAFQERVEILSAVDWAGIGVDLALYGNWDTLSDGHPLTKWVKGDVIPNEQAVALYRRAAINLNIYRTSKGFGEDAPRIVGAESLNPRALELAACGAFFLSDDRAESREVFGDLVPTFKDASELEALIVRYLNDPAERARRAAKLPQCVAGRTFDAMARRVVADLARYGARRPQRRAA